MPIIAVVNRKGGSGKSTIAVHLAAHLSTAPRPALLGDVDRQQSTQGWLRRRAARKRSRVIGWSIDPKSMVRPPAGSGPLVLDTPGGLRGFELARVVMYADAILMPVGASAFDRESAADCLAELQALPRVATGRCQLAVVGMRIDGRTRGAQTLAAWASSVGVPLLGVLRESQNYVRCVEDGLTVFDLPPSETRTDLAQWAPVLRWVDAAMAGDAHAADAPTRLPASLSVDAPAPLAASASLAPPPTSARAPLDTMADRAAAEHEPVGRSPAAPRIAERNHPTRALPVIASSAPLLKPSTLPSRAPLRAGIGAELGRLLGALAIPRFLQRDRAA